MGVNPRFRAEARVDRVADFVTALQQQAEAVYAVPADTKRCPWCYCVPPRHMPDCRFGDDPGDTVSYGWRKPKPLPRPSYTVPHVYSDGKERTLEEVLIARLRWRHSRRWWKRGLAHDACLELIEYRERDLGLYRPDDPAPATVHYTRARQP